MRRFLMALAAAAGLLGAPFVAHAQTAPNVAPNNVVVGPEVAVGAPLVEMGTADLGGTRIVAQADYIHWWTRGVNIPPIVTTGNPASARAGALNDPGTQTLFGNRLDYGDTNGARFGLLLEGDCMSADVSFFYLSPMDVKFNLASGANGVPVIAVPFFNTPDSGFPAGEQRFRVANPSPAPAFGVPDFNGNIAVNSRLEYWGFDTNAYWTWRRNDFGRTDFGLGFRYLNLKNTFGIDAFSNQVDLVGNPLPLTINDTFNTENDFYGLQLAYKGHYNVFRHVNFDVLSKLALGVTHEQISIRGSTSTTAPGVGPDPNGFFAQSGNSGRTTHDEFAVVPQVQLRLSYDLFCWFRVYGGYEFMYLSSVALAGDQIDRNINVSYIPGFGPSAGLNSPLRNDHKTDFFTHGVTFGFELSF